MMQTLRKLAVLLALAAFASSSFAFYDPDDWEGGSPGGGGGGSSNPAAGYASTSDYYAHLDQTNDPQLYAGLDALSNATRYGDSEAVVVTGSSFADMVHSEGMNELFFPDPVLADLKGQNRDKCVGICKSQNEKDTTICNLTAVRLGAVAAFTSAALGAVVGVGTGSAISAIWSPALGVPAGIRAGQVAFTASGATLGAGVAAYTLACQATAAATLQSCTNQTCGG
jgi:hypothetical protein